MAQITEEFVAQFIHLHRQGFSYRAIGAKYKVDPRTVQSRIQKAEGERDRDHWEAVSQQVDARYLVEHLNMQVRVSIDVQLAVRSNPFQSNWERVASFRPRTR